MTRRQLAALERRLTLSKGPTLEVTYKDGTKKIINSGAAITAFRDGKATHAESRSGQNGLLPDLLCALAETE